MNISLPPELYFDHETDGKNPQRLQVRGFEIKTTNLIASDRWGQSISDTSAFLYKADGTPGNAKRYVSLFATDIPSAVKELCREQLLETARKRLLAVTAELTEEIAALEVLSFMDEERGEQ